MEPILFYTKDQYFYFCYFEMIENIFFSNFKVFYRSMTIIFMLSRFRPQRVSKNTPFYLKADFSYDLFWNWVWNVLNECSCLKLILVRIGSALLYYLDLNRLVLILCLC